ncbi:MAG: glycosyltransferase family 4 protein [Thermoplasmata archaeon]|nr:MAG: glycosyltransferase family 4 protein [Thermoplasmata archaeon]
MISVVCLRYYPAVGGVETTVLETTCRLAESFQMKVVTSDLKVEKPFQRLSEKERLSEYKNVPITHLESKKFLPVEGYGVKMKGLLDAVSGSEMIHAHSYGAHHSDKVIKMTHKNGIPSILTTYLHPSTYSHHKILRSFYDSTVGRRTLNRATSIITLTNNEKDYIINRFGIPGEKIKVIPSGVDLAKFRDLGRKREENTLLFVGRLSPVKRLDMLLRALAKVKKKIPDVKLRIVGKDWGVKSDLVDLAKTLNIENNIEFLEELSFEGLINQYNSAKALVLTSRFETFGVVIMEAMACGTPAVAVGVGGIPEVVGDSGILCKDNEESVAQGIIKMLTNHEKYDSLKENTKKRRELFSWDLVSQKVKSLYEDTLKAV